VAVPEPDRRARIRRIREIQRELQELRRQTQPPITARSVGIWIVSGGLAATGVAMSVPSGGWSLLVSVVEPVFGQSKQARGFRQFLLWGLEKVQGEWSLVCTTHNILKLYRLYG
jgi:hypothetical protein